MTVKMKGVGKRIKHLRKLLRLRQCDLADLIGVERGAVSNWEREKGIKTDNLALVADKTGAPFDWLATGRGVGPLTKEQLLVAQVHKRSAAERMAPERQNIADKERQVATSESQEAITEAKMLIIDKALAIAAVSEMLNIVQKIARDLEYELDPEILEEAASIAIEAATIEPGGNRETHTPDALRSEIAAIAKGFFRSEYRKSAGRMS